jgi:hypothetical protein
VPKLVSEVEACLSERLESERGDLEEEIYMDQPKSFIIPGKETFVYKLKKLLYGLKQSPR